MKKLVIIAVASMMVSLGAKAQGFVTFANTSNAGSQVSTNNGVAGKTATGANGFYYALFYSTAQTAVNGNASAVQGNGGSSAYVFNNLGGAGGWTFAGAGVTSQNSGYATNGAAGRVFGSGPNGTGTPPQDQAVAGLAGGSVAQFVIIGWSANLGATWQNVQSFLNAPANDLAYTGGTALFGQSGVSVPVTVGDGLLIGTPTIMAPAGGGAVAGFTLGVIPVPEPATIALASLGGLSLLAFRRRKA